jgi:pimeloyl-ACP methyl ester carboxylesterase
LPLGVPQVVSHGSDDAVVPVAMARDYVRAAAAMGDDVTLRELSGLGHMEFLDPTSVAHEALCGELASRFSGAPNEGAGPGNTRDDSALSPP